jgi:hypothetical protein
LFLEATEMIAFEVLLLTFFEAALIGSAPGAGVVEMQSR